MTFAVAFPALSIKPKCKLQMRSGSSLGAAFIRSFSLTPRVSPG